MNKHASLVLLVSLLAAPLACSNKDESTTAATTTDTTTTVTEGTTPGATASTAAKVAVVGQLNLNLGLTATTLGVLQWKIVGGMVAGAAKEIAVDADGKFAVEVDKGLDTIDSLLAELDKETIDIDVMAPLAAEVVSATVEQVKSYYAEDPAEVKAHIKEEALRAKEAGTVTMLVAYEKSGDKTAEAQSFRFIGLPTASGKNLSAIDTQGIIGDLNLGKISDGTGDDAKSELTSAAALSISAEAQESLADAGKALKAIKNIWMNDSWSAEPFFMWRHTAGTASAIDQFSVPSASFFNGTGFYVSSNATPFVFADLCGASKKTVSFDPPAAVKMAQYSNTGTLNSESTVSAFTNGNVSESTQDGSKVCQGDPFYAREDGTNDFMLNFGTGGSIQDASAEGLWKLKYDGTEIARFDMSAGAPVDSNKMPTVFYPSLKVISSGDNYTGAEVELYRWTGTAFEKITDLTAAVKLMSQATVGLNGTSNEGRNSAVMNAAKTKLVVTLESPVAKSSVTNFAFSYQIGAASYRVEYRD